MIYFLCQSHLKNRFIKKNKQRVYFYDDMTYNHEKGLMKYYEDEIKLLGQLSHVKYYGLSEINKILEGLEWKNKNTE